MTVGIENLKSTLVSLTDVIVVGVKVVKAIPAIQAEIQDLTLEESIALISDAIIVEIPKVVAAFRVTA